jgi:hypothetical protein
VPSSSSDWAQATRIPNLPTVWPSHGGHATEPHLHPKDMRNLIPSCGEVTVVQAEGLFVLLRQRHEHVAREHERPAQRGYGAPTFRRAPTLRVGRETGEERVSCVWDRRDLRWFGGDTGSVQTISAGRGTRASDPSAIPGVGRRRQSAVWLRRPPKGTSCERLRLHQCVTRYPEKRPVCPAVMVGRRSLTRQRCLRSSRRAAATPVQGIL